MIKRIEVIITKSKLSFDSIYNLPRADSGNLPDVIFLEKLQSASLNNIPKIDLLIVDEWADKTQINRMFHVKHIINLTSAPLRDDEILLKKPFKYSEISQIIQASRNSNKIFCKINDSYIYNEIIPALYITNSEYIKFTERENEIFAAFIKSPEYKLTKSHLSSEIWKHNKDIDSNTVESHIYKLKQRLPAGLLEIEPDFIRLNIKSLI